MTKVTTASIRADMKAQGIHRPVYPGGTVRISHLSCPAGKDTRNRLYLKAPTKPGNVLLWYCHNCGEGGAFKTTLHPAGHAFFPTPRASLEADISSIMAAGLPITDEVYEETKVHDYLSVRTKWCAHSSIPEMLEVARIVYNPSEQTLLWPAGGNRQDVKLFACQERKLVTPLRGPKVITHKQDEHSRLGRLMQNNETNGTVVIVEDWLSAMAIYWSTPATAAYCLYGTHCTVDDLLNLKGMGYRDLVVWLDNDSELVKQKARQIAKRATLLGMGARLDLLSADPKYAAIGLLKRGFHEYTEIR